MLRGGFGAGEGWVGGWVDEVHRRHHRHLRHDGVMYSTAVHGGFSSQFLSGCFLVVVVVMIVAVVHTKTSSQLH